MERKRKKSKKKILIISLITIFVVLLLVLAYFLIFKRDIFTYKNKITIEVGDTIPSVKDYLYKDNKKVKEITWKETFSEDNKIYKPGTYKGTFTYKGEEKEVTLIVQDTTSPVIEGIKDIEVLAFSDKPNLLEGITVPIIVKKE